MLKMYHKRKKNSINLKYKSKEDPYRHSLFSLSLEIPLFPLLPLPVFYKEWFSYPNIFLPAVKSAFTFPVRMLPSNGLAFPLLKNSPESTVHRSSGSTSAMSAS